jgi:hypothetical protein
MSGKKKSALARNSNFGMEDEQAITETLGALFILAIMLTATTFFYARQLPAWTEEFEYQHAAKVPQDFAELASTIDMALASRDPSSPGSTSIGMIPEGVPLVGIHASGGTIRFEQDQERFECIASAFPPENTSDKCWNDTSSWNNFDMYHVMVTESGAKLAPETGEDIIINTSRTIPGGEYYHGKFTVTNNATLSVEGRLTIHAMSILIENGSITVNGWGYAGGSGNNPGYNGSGAGRGIGGNVSGNPNEGGYGGGGGGGGGDGGDGGNNSDSGGSASHLNDSMGSGGGGGGDWKEPNGKIVLSSGGNGGAGGGYIQLDASTIDIDIRGTLSANGSNGQGGGGTKKNFFGGGGGGGSGGMVIIKGNIVNITGMLYATGGDGGRNDNKGTGGGGGGGGEIRVSYDSSVYPDPGDINTTHINVSYGVGGLSGKTGAENGQNGAPGTHLVSQARYYPSILYHSTGYIISNMTNVSGQGQVGYNTNSSTLICYGNLTYGADLLHDTSIIVKVRTSMCSDMHDAVPWEDCPPVISGQDISDLISVSDGHQYLQWRAELYTFDPRITPELHWVDITYETGKRPVLVTASGKLEYASQYLYLPNYQLVYTQGGTIKHQAEGGFMLFAPPIVISTADNRTMLKITSRDLKGSERTMSGRLSATVQATYENATLLKNGLNYADITLNLTTSYPAEWERWFNDSCRNAGVPYGNKSGQYEVNQTGNMLQITFYGNETKPVNLWLKRSIAEIELQS